jgi:hypothetical protein
MRQPKNRTTRRSSDTGDLGQLGAELGRLRRRCRQLKRRADIDWATWSAAVEETNALAQRIGRTPPDDLAGLLVRYDALPGQCSKPMM